VNIIVNAGAVLMPLSLERQFYFQPSIKIKMGLFIIFFGVEPDRCHITGWRRIFEGIKHLQVMAE